MKKCYFIFLLLLILLFLFIYKKKQSIVETFDVNATTENKIKNELIITWFMEDITNAINNFYLEYYTGEIEVYEYEIVILKVKKVDNGKILIKFGVTPQIGAHNPLGYDVLLYVVDSVGNKELLQYEHKESYPIPERFKKNLTTFIPKFRYSVIYCNGVRLCV
ncbi:MAG: DUF3888 domain-containing protein [Lachnospiraceae bacterium]